MTVKRTERGWAGHFICSDRCLFRRNTLLQFNGLEIVISTVGLMKKTNEHGFDTVGHDRYFETMAFHSKPNDRWKDADVSRQVYFKSNWAINEIDADDKANDMHEAVVEEITNGLVNGNKYPTHEE